MRIIIIGAGPGGMDTAIEAARQGHKVTLIEKDLVGGTCLNHGCIPTKALARSSQLALDLNSCKEFGLCVENHAIDYEQVIEHKNKVVNELREGAVMSLKNIDIIYGEASFISSNEIEINGEHLTGDKIIIATGSRPSVLNIQGHELAVTSDQFLDKKTLFKNVVIIGGGVIGIEFASILSSFGANVTVIEFCKEILPPFDKDIAKRLRTTLTKRGINIITSAEVTKIYDGYKVEYKGKKGEETIDADQVIMSVGRKPNFPSGLDRAGISYTSKGITVNDNFQTNIPHIYAIGDVNGICMLAHAATAQGRKILGEDVAMNIVPSAVFSVPECGMVGLTEEECKLKNKNYRVDKAFFRSNGKAVCMGETDGLVKLIVDVDTEEILGCHICGTHASDLIAEIALAMANRMSLSAIRKTIHAHPTLSEIIFTVCNE